MECPTRSDHFILKENHVLSGRAPVKPLRTFCWNQIAKSFVWKPFPNETKPYCKPYTLFFNIFQMLRWFQGGYSMSRIGPSDAAVFHVEGYPPDPSVEGHHHGMQTQLLSSPWMCHMQPLGRHMSGKGTSHQSK